MAFNSMGLRVMVVMAVLFIQQRLFDMDGGVVCGATGSRSNWSRIH